MQDPPPWRSKRRRPWTPAEQAELLALTEQVGGLSQTPAGPQLSAALAAVDVDRLPDSLLVDVLLARTRQVNHEQGEQLVMAMRIMLCDVPGGEPIGKAPPLKLVQWAIDEIRAALTLTRTAATQLCRLSWDLHHRLPKVLAAMLTGTLDKPRARVFSTWTAELSPDHTAALVAELLPVAPDLTTGELMDAIAKQAIALDPEWVRRRYERALLGRRVEGKRNADGTATLTGHDLPLDEVAAACARLDALASAAKAAGHPDRLDHLRADLLVGMITGRYTSMTDQHILADLLATAAKPDPTQPNPTTPNDDRNHDHPNDHDPDDSGPGDDDPGDDDPDDSGPGGDDPADDGPDNDNPDDNGSGGDDPDETGPDGDDPDGDDPGDDSPNDDDLGGGDPGADNPGCAGPADDGGPKPRLDSDFPDGGGPDGAGPGDAAARGDDGPGDDPLVDDSVDDPAADDARHHNPTDNDSDRDAPDRDAPDRDAPDRDAPDRDAPDRDAPDAGDSAGRGGDGADADGLDSDGSAGGNPAGDAAELDGEGDDPAGGEPDGDGDGPNGEEPNGAGAGSGRVGQRAGLRLWLGLGTLIGADQHPGEALGWGPVHAQLAIDLALSLPSWWVVLTDSTETVQAIVAVRRHPTGAASRTAPDRRFGEVWLQVDPDTLKRYTELDRAGKVAPDWSHLLAEINRRVADTPPGPPNGDPTARLPGAALRRWIAVRDRYCTFRGCRTPAHRADADHIIAYAYGGQTVDVDLAAACRHDHVLRTDGRWTVIQLTPGRVVWTSPLGRQYTRHPPLGLLELAEPRPDAVCADDPDPEVEIPCDPMPWWDPVSCLQPEPQPKPTPAKPKPPRQSPTDYLRLDGDPTQPIDSDEEIPF